MCQLASFIVTRERVLFHPESDSHEKIIEYFKLDDKEKSDFVRVELVPLNNDYLIPLKKWIYETDQTETPEWYNAKEAEIAVRGRMAAWMKQRPWFFKSMEFVKTVKKVKYFGWKNLKSKPIKSWKVFDTRDAAWAAAEDAVGDAAGAAAWDAAWAAAEAAAGDAAEAAAEDAVGDAALLARCIIISDKLDKKHMTHANARWQVWKKGFGLLCDVNGIFYVYRRP